MVMLWLIFNYAWDILTVPCDWLLTQSVAVDVWSVSHPPSVQCVAPPSSSPLGHVSSIVHIHRPLIHSIVSAEVILLLIKPSDNELWIFFTNQTLRQWIVEMKELLVVITCTASFIDNFKISLISVNVIIT